MLITLLGKAEFIEKATPPKSEPTEIELASFKRKKPEIASS